MVETSTQEASRRSRNRQGEGARLREELIRAADRILAETGDGEGLSLRGVAKEAGVAAPSIYLHFTDKRDLVRAVMLARFAELSRAIEDAGGAAADPPGRLRAGCLAYCRFALDQPGAYRVLFGNRTVLLLEAAGDEPTGLDTFALLIDAIQSCIDEGSAPPGDAARIATNMWSAMHGAVTLRRSSPPFPWPPLEQQIDDLLTGLVGLRTSAPRADPDAQGIAGISAE